jgi:predicted MFS family arabinose efflux permease
MSAVDHRIAGAASGLFQTAIQLGASVGIAVLVLVDAMAGSTGVFVASAVLLLGALLAMSLRDPHP